LIKPSTSQKQTISSSSTCRTTGRFDAGDNWYGYIAPAEAVQIQGRYYFGFLPYQPALYGAIPARRSEPRVTARQVLDPESPVVLQARS